MSTRTRGGRQAKATSRIAGAVKGFFSDKISPKGMSIGNFKQNVKEVAKSVKKAFTPPKSSGKKGKSRR